jgi:predicted RNA-binding protein associated with RNAse of E/G family
LSWASRFDKRLELYVDVGESMGKEESTLSIEGLMLGVKGQERVIAFEGVCCGKV